MKIYYNILKLYHTIVFYKSILLFTIVYLYYNIVYFSQLYLTTQDFTTRKVFFFLEFQNWQSYSFFD